MSAPEISAHSVAAEVMLQRNRRPGTVLLVEGPSDKRLLRKFISIRPEHCVPCGGFLNVVGAMQILAERATPLVYGVVDADRIDEADEQLRRNLAGTDYRDADVLVLTTEDILLSLCIEFSGGDLAENEHSACLQLAVRAASMVGHLRQASQVHDLKLNLSGFPIGQVWSGEGELDVHALVALAIARTADPPSTQRVLDSLARIVSEAAEEPIRFCQGHDLAKALSTVFRHRWQGCQVGFGTIQTMARVAYTAEHFDQTRLRARLREFEERDGAEILRRSA